MDKISTAEVAQVLGEVPDLLRGLVDENKDLREKVAAYERSEHAETIVTKMEDRGQFVEGRTAQEKVANLLSEGRDLNVLEAAVDMVAPNGSLVSVGDEPGGGNSDLESYILGDLT
jgi:hypothetical protein